MKFQVVIIIFMMLRNFYVESHFKGNSYNRKFEPLFRLGRDALTMFVQPRTFQRGLELNIKRDKVQRQFSNNTRFFCDVHGPGARSKVVPKSVHMLRPGDIDIVGAIGDSLTAANGAFALDVLQVLIEGRGVSWSIGGHKTWRNFLTLPNILKEFNPNLYGFSTAGTSSSTHKSSRFNVAEAGAQISDTVHQARNLVKRMRSDPHVDMKNHWKLVTYMIGGNDFCLDICYHQNQDKVLEKAGRELTLALRIIRENLPRTMVNVLLPPDVTILERFTNKPAECKTLNYVECPCFFSLTHRKNRDRSAQTIKRWMKLVEKITKLPEFHDRSDFEVNFHPLFSETDIPKDAYGVTQYKYMSKDCFHLSQLGHARAANSYWNSMLTPENQRLRAWQEEFSMSLTTISIFNDNKKQLIHRTVFKARCKVKKMFQEFKD
ncbi:CLUMA_CG010439, isoform A [Clunio marinus]|uniref:Phospholipase B1, membrane-associated n=1 Tax=Clunio marinus TaxID=568069 RepID=A0A1J1IC20_9DIPT|nr:CLUMA_CG010439, isoform A [Clunio marinus]